MSDLVEQLRAQSARLREKAIGDCPNANPDCHIPGCMKPRSLADLIDGMLRRHWKDVQGWCDNCIERFPCRDLEDLARHVTSVIGEVTA